MSAVAGAEFLDREVPGWADRIDTDVLEMSNSCACILGQLWGTYSEGLEALEIGDPYYSDSDPMSENEAVDYGFNAYADEEFAELRDEWLAEILLRREAVLA